MFENVYYTALAAQGLIYNKSIVVMYLTNTYTSGK